MIDITPIPDQSQYDFNFYMKRLNDHFLYFVLQSPFKLQQQYNYHIHQYHIHYFIKYYDKMTNVFFNSSHTLTSELIIFESMQGLIDQFNKSNHL